MKRWLRVVATLVVSALAVTYIVLKIDLSKTLHIIGSASVPWLLASAFLTIVTVPPQAWRWQQLLSVRGVHEGAEADRGIAPSVLVQGSHHGSDAALLQAAAARPIAHERGDLMSRTHQGVAYRTSDVARDPGQENSHSYVQFAEKVGGSL